MSWPYLCPDSINGVRAPLARKKNNMSELQAALMLAATISNFSWLPVLRDWWWRE